jgi:nucleoside-diphosphate-sugar epimerase
MNAGRLDRALVSGASGFVGRALVAHLEASATPLRFGEGDWLEQVKAADFRGATVFHLAAKVHGTQPDLDSVYMHDNVEKTRELARAAATGGARRLVFLSTVKVHGEETRARAFTSDDGPQPEGAYARSKWAAEQALAAAGDLEIAIVRAPLVYGPGVKGNLLSLLRLADSPWPLPFGAIDNRRSFVHVDDLARLLIECALLPQAAGGTFLAAHAESISTPRLLAAMRSHLGRPPRLLRVRPGMIEAAAAATGQSDRLRPLTRSLEVDAAPTTARLGWTAQIGFDTSVEDTVRAYREASA